MPWPQDVLTTDETIVATFRPHWKLLALPVVWFLGLSVAWGFVINWISIGIWGFLVYFALVLGLVVKPAITWWTTLYALSTERLMTRHGLISKSGIEIPLENITNVNFSQTVFERIIGAGDLLVESAGTSGQSRFKDIPHPDQFQTELYRVREERTLHLSGRHRTAPQRGGVGNAETIEKLAELNAAGHITDEEFAIKKRELLEDM